MEFEWKIADESDAVGCGWTQTRCCCYECCMFSICSGYGSSTELGARAVLGLLEVFA